MMRIVCILVVIVTWWFNLHSIEHHAVIIMWDHVLVIGLPSLLNKRQNWGIAFKSDALWKVDKLQSWHGMFAFIEYEYKRVLKCILSTTRELTWISLWLSFLALLAKSGQVVHMLLSSHWFRSGMLSHSDCRQARIVYIVTERNRVVFSS